jgi:hypothetical protein
VHGVVAAAAARRSTLQASRTSSGSFASDGPIATRWTNGDADCETRAAGHRHVATERIGDQIDLVPELGERTDPVEFAERSSAGLEERLGRNHQKAHDL